MRLDPKLIRFASVMGSAVVTKAALVFGGWYLGTKLDAEWGTSPVMLLVGITLGLAVGLWNLLRTAEKLNR